MPFEYLPTDNDILECQKLFSKHYKQDLVDKFINIMLVNKKFFINDKNLIESKNDKLDRLNKIVDTLAWWIPVRKWRDNFRNKFKI